MAFFTIKNTPIYLPQEKLISMKRDLAGDAVAYARSMLDGKTADDLETKLVERLTKESETDPGAFYQNWISLRLYGESAQKNIFWLIADYIKFTGIGRLVDLREPAEKLVDSQSGADFELPYGPYFAFEVDLDPGALRRRKRSLQVHISIEGVDKVLGEFPSFRLYTSSFDVQFGGEVTVLPSLSRGGANPVEPTA
jgi:hypothetical protein